MKNIWLGYLSSILLFIAGIFMILGDKTLVGIVFMVLAVTGIVLRSIMNKHKPRD